MRLSFFKYQGTGNDFILIDNRNKMIEKNNVKLIKKLCDRRFGIGADGLMLLENKQAYDFEMIYYNSDGNESSMCGNGGRCIVAFANRLGIVKDKAIFWAIDGEHTATSPPAHLQRRGEGESPKEMIISLKMINVNQIEIGEDFYYLNTGSPHYVKFIENVANINVYEEGRNIRYNERFKKEGTNVNFIEESKDYADSISIRTYERGVENETLSCGTGVTAAALAWAVKNDIKKEHSCRILTQGGRLNVKFNRSSIQMFKDIWLEGPATFVFEGEIDV